MFSVIFPGQGSQVIGMAKEFYDNFKYVKDYFDFADELSKKSLTKMIFEGPKEDLDQTENTQSAIFLVSYCIFKVLKKETELNLNKAKFFAGHSLGEYSALCCAGSINFEQTINLLINRGKAMQNAVTKGDGGMIAILGKEIDEINKMIENLNDNLRCYIANDNTFGQVVISGKTSSLDNFGNILKKNNIKYINLPVSAPFHCPLMSKATTEMKHKILETNFYDPSVSIISNVTATPHKDSNEIKKLLIDQIEKPVRWRESVINMIDFGVNKFIEIVPGKVLSGLIKRIDRNVKLNQINNLSDIKNIEND